MNEHVKVRFRIEGANPDEYEVESMWAIKRSEGYELDNIPFFAYSVAVGDIVAAEVDDEGCLWFESVLKPSRHSTVRLLMVSADDVQGVRDHLKGMGCSSEASDLPKLIAVDVPPGVDYSKIREYLEQMTQEGVFEYEEGCLGFIEGGNT